MIYIIVPTFGRLLQTKKFVESLDNSINEQYQLLIIDDHPEKITYKNIKETNKIRVIVSDKELWWVGSINLGIEILYNEYDLNDNDVIIFANNDVQINQDTFKVMYDELSKNNKQILHPRTFNQDKKEVSSGTKILSFLPYLTIHPKNFNENKFQIDMGTARFLFTSGLVLKKIGFINPQLIQYGGDNDFTLSAKRLHNINTYIMRNTYCNLDDTETGIKNQNIKSFKEFYKSFTSIKSPNNIKYRYILFRKFFGTLKSFLIVLSLSTNSLVKFLINKITG